MKGRHVWSLTRTLCKNGAQRRRLFQPLVAVRLDECQGHPQLRVPLGYLEAWAWFLISPVGSRSRVEWGAVFCVSPCSISLPSDFDERQGSWGSPPIRVSPSSLALLLELLLLLFLLISCPLTSAYISQAGGGPLGSWVVGGWGRG